MEIANRLTAHRIKSRLILLIMSDGKPPVNDAIDSDSNGTQKAKDYIKKNHGDVEPNKVPSKTGDVC